MCESAYFCTAWIDVCGDNSRSHGVQVLKHTETMGSQSLALHKVLKKELKDHDSNPEYQTLMQGVSFTAWVSQTDLVRLWNTKECRLWKKIARETFHWILSRHGLRLSCCGDAKLSVALLAVETVALLLWHLHRPRFGTTQGRFRSCRRCRERRLPKSSRRPVRRVYHLEQSLVLTAFCFSFEW